MDHPDKTLDAAVRTYLGGDYESGAIQIGMRDERIADRFGAEANQLKLWIEKILSDALAYASDQTSSESITVYSWIARSNPDLSHVAIAKLESAVIYELEH